MTGNLLGQETSPYLLQHKDNPVHWRPWNQAALDDAARLDRPILLSIGYAACHWCHVMAHESFEDPETAAVMNDNFINIKVDREERPDLDAIYQGALALIGEQGGWPLTMFLAPDGKPFWGGTYFPPRASYGRPAFKDVLRRVAEVYRTQPETVAKNTAAITGALRERSQGAPEATLTPRILDLAAERLNEGIDQAHGGFAGAPKFPQTFLLELLWRAHLRTGNESYAESVFTSLTHMCQGGIFDHLGGGFARYAVDPHWLVPHFEKMLYDNALLIDLLTAVWRKTGDPLYAARVKETVGWLLREMRLEGGAFAASVDADSEGEEGKFYVWSREEISRVLGADAARFANAYDVSESGNWEGHNILNRLQAPRHFDPAEEATLAPLRETLLDERAKRVWPQRDDKVLSDWNGLAIAALAAAGSAFDEPEWIAAAEEAFRFVSGTMSENGRLFQAWRAGKRQHAAVADAYANMARAALALREATSDEAYLTDARLWTRTLDEHFWDDAAGGYFFTADDAEALITRTRTAGDNAVPSANGTMVRVLATLYNLTGEKTYLDRADRILGAFAGEVARNLFPMGTLLNAFEYRLSAASLVIIGDKDDPATRDMVASARRSPGLDLITLRLDETGHLPDGHPAAGKTKISGRPTAYLCRGTTCSPPVTRADDLAALLAA